MCTSLDTPVLSVTIQYSCSAIVYFYYAYNVFDIVIDVLIKLCFCTEVIVVVLYWTAI